MVVPAPIFPKEVVQLVEEREISAICRVVVEESRFALLL
jgi:hypothetical protein